MILHEDGRCEVKRCRAGAAITNLGHGVCEKHWNQLTAEEVPPDAIRMVLGIEADATSAMEDTTMEPTTGKTANMEAAASSTGAGKSTRPSKAPKAPKKAKTAKGSKPKKEKAPKQPVVVFAFRLSEADRALIHKAAGPAKATKFVRGAALAAANVDTKAFDALIAQAKTNLK